MARTAALFRSMPQGQALDLEIPAVFKMQDVGLSGLGHDLHIPLANEPHPIRLNGQFPAVKGFRPMVGAPQVRLALVFCIGQIVGTRL